MTDCALCSRVLNCYNTNYSTLLGEKYPLYQNVKGFLGTSLCNNCIKIITEVRHLIKEGVPINISNLKETLEDIQIKITKNNELTGLRDEISVLKAHNVMHPSIKLSPQINPEFIDKYGLEPQIVVDKNNKKYDISISKSQCVFEALCPPGTIFEVTYLYIPGCKIGCCDVMTGHIQNYENGCAIIEIIKNGKCILHRYDDKNLRILWIKKNGIRTEVIY